MTTSNTQNNYMPQLDALRAFAVILVFIHHWLPSDSLLNFLPTGPMGVTLFFVLSGFLISRILLQNRKAVANGQLSGKQALWLFYVRRTLRIFPLYFIVIFLCFNFNVENIGPKFIWFATYSSNILHFSKGEWMGILSHLWTLAVEEQYYLFIPFVLLFTPQRFLWATICTCIAIGPISRVLIYFLLPDEKPEIVTSVLVFSAMDCFGLGTLLAYVRSEKCKEYNDRFDMFMWNMFVVGVVAFLFMAVWGIEDLTTLSLRTIFSMVCLYVIDLAAKGVGGRMKKVLENPALLYLGKISYGMYIFHMFMPYIWHELVTAFSDQVAFSFLTTLTPEMLFGVFFLCTVVVASFSWHFVEKPLNDLKRHFEYQGTYTTPRFLLNPRLNVGLLTLVLFFLYPQISRQVFGESPTKSTVKLLKTSKTGLYISDFNKIPTDTGFFMPTNIPLHFDMISIYMAWGEGKEFELPLQQLQKLEKQDKQVFLTWEPWTATFPSMKMDNKEVYKKVNEGVFDDYFLKQARLLNQLKNPVFIRWGHNADRLDCPWSAITDQEVRHYKNAHIYLQQFFDKHAKNKVRWVWPAPNANRLADYYPENYRFDFIGCPGVNTGIDKTDPNWREFSEIYGKYKRELQRVAHLKKVPVFITELGLEQRSVNEADWYKTAFKNLEEDDNVHYAMLFGFHKAVLWQLASGKNQYKSSF